jgi:hypothetical protein
MDPYERELCRTFLVWLPFGGPQPTEIHASFGISVTRAIDLVRELLSTTDIRSIPEADQDLLRRVAAAENTIRALDVIGRQRAQHWHQPPKNRALPPPVTATQQKPRDARAPAPLVNRVSLKRDLRGGLR